MNAAKYNVYRKAILDFQLNAGVWVPPAQVKVRLFTGAPTAAGGGVPVVGGGYLDQTIAWNGTFAPASSLVGGVTRSVLAGVVNFGVANGAAWGTEANPIRAVDFRRADNDFLMWYSIFDEPVVVLDRVGFVFDTDDITWIEE